MTIFRFTMINALKWVQHAWHWFGLWNNPLNFRGLFRSRRHVKEFAKYYKMPGIGLVCKTTLWNFENYEKRNSIFTLSQNSQHFTKVNILECCHDIQIHHNKYIEMNTKCLELVWFLKQPFDISRIMKNQFHYTWRSRTHII